MKKIITFIFMIVCICGYAQTIDPVLLEEMGQHRDNEKIRVFVVMRQQCDQQQLNRRAAHFTSRAERRDFVVNELKQFAETSQYDLRHSLAEMQQIDLVSEPKVLWIANAIYFEATREAILSLANRTDIMVIGFNEERNWLPDGEESHPAALTREITSNVTQVNANQVWNLGYTGQGVVVAVIDTGVNYEHLDLADHLWDGGIEFPHHGYDIFNDDNDPMDDHGHGTHCAGTICGDGTAGSQTGIAPDATLMCVKCLNSSGGCEDTHVISAMQWAVDHGCDVISMSLGGHGHSGAEKTIIRNTCVNVLASGVIASIAAGNEGESLYDFPIPDNVGLPGGCPPPYLDPDQQQNPGGLSCSVCVGAVDSNDEAAYFTSHGPSTWYDSDYADYPYTEGSQTAFGLIRPDVCAPGVDIISADSWNNTGYTTMSGTSMATPCVAGCMALMLSKNPDATPEELCRILEETAVPLSTWKSNIFGYGRVNALAAVNALQINPLKLESFAINDEQGNNDGNLNAGESVTLDLTLMNNSDNALDEATLVLSTASEYVTITNGTATLPHFDAGQTKTIDNIFAFTLNGNPPGNRLIQFTAETFINGESFGIISISVMVYCYALRFDEVTVLNDDNGNGTLEAGETADLHVVISNIGNETATSIVGTLSSSFPYLTINDISKSFGNIEIDGQTFADFNVTLSNNVPDIYVINLTLDLVDSNEQHSNMNFELVKGIIVFADANVKAICISHWDTNGDGGLSYAEAAVVTDLFGFENNTEITSFNELQYFTGLNSINDYAFINCTSLTTIAIPNSVTWIGNSAFEGCNSLTSLSIPNSVTSIGSYAFRGCTGFTGSLTLPSSLTSIGSYAFYNCRGFTGSLTIPNSVTLIGQCAFSQCSGFTGSLTIGNSVTSIGESAFESCSGLTSVSIPNSVNVIGRYVFKGCNSLDSVSIPNSVTLIGYGAFSSCSSLTSVSIPNSVVSIDSFAFSGCSGLTTLIIGNSVTSIGYSAFGSCNGLSAIYYTGNPYQWCNIYFNNYYSNPLYYGHNLFIDNELVTDLVIPETVTIIKSYSFYGATCLISLSIPNSVTSIGRDAFNDCSGLTSVTIGNSVSEMDQGAFSGCIGLNAVYYTGDISQWCNIQFPNFTSTPLSYAHNLYIDNELVTDLVIPESVTEIKPYAFDGTTCLTSLTLPNSVTSLGNNAFYGCSGLTSVSIGNSVSLIDEWAFYNCSNLNSVYYTGDIYQWCNIQFSNHSSNPLYFAHNLFIENDLVCNLAIPETVTEIKPYAFYNASCLTSLTIPNSVTSIGDNAFYGCHNIFCITNFAETPPILGINTFSSTNSNSVIYVPCSFEEAYASISWGGFSNFSEMCGGMVNVVANPEEGGTVSGGGAFEAGQTCTIIATADQNYTFANWTMNGLIVSYDNEYTFYVAGDMTLVAHFVPDGNIIFANPNVKSICVSHWDANGDGELSYAEAALVTDLGTCFQNNSVITSFNELQYFIGLASINDAFYGCTRLATITLPNSVTSLYGSFYNCNSLNAVYYTGDISQWCNIHFSGYSSNPLYYAHNLYIDNELVTDLVIPEAVTKIKNNAFDGATCLRLLTIPNTITSIGSYAFRGCSNLCFITSLAETPPSLGDHSWETSGSNTIVFVPCGFENAYASLSWGGFSNFHGMCGGTVTVTANPEEGGVVTGGGTFEAGQTCTVSATPAEGYDVRWTLNGIVVSNNIEYTFYVSGDMTLVALFAPEGNIAFADSNVKSICVSHWDTNNDGELSYMEAASVTNLNKYFFNSNIIWFNELKYFIGLTNIGSMAFKNCKGLKSIGLPNSVTSTDNEAFNYCNSLNAVYYTGDISQWCNIQFSNFTSTPLYYAHNLYIDNELVTDLVIPESVTEIKPYAFFSATCIASLTIPNSVTSIGNNAFCNCSGLTGNLTIPNSVISVGNVVFSGCNRLTTLTIGNSVTSIGNYAFRSCSNLESITVLAGTPPTIQSSTFYNCPKSIPVYVPCGSLEAYQSAEYWNEFTNIQEVCTQSQTVTLSAGWNWWSSNVDITLDDLKADLLEALPDATSITIKSQTQSTSYNGSYWRGALNVIDVAQMYEIYTPESCTITLSGLPINPTEHPASIVANGNTWIGFPLNESMSVTTAFAGLNPVNGDIIKSKEGRATYNGSIWRGTLQYLEPGQGYIYKSNANETKTFVFPTDR